jgi:hypothetical protein
MKILIRFLFAAIFTIPISTGESQMLALSNQKTKRQINTCGDLQRRANKLWSSDNVSFQGFENLQLNTRATISNAGDDRLCQLGYITEITPMGKMVCQGYLYADVNKTSIRWNHGYFRQTLYDPVYNKSDFCRYVS